ncbi:hypothetical protein K458DRAFT_293935 [Lentithecium fluviatile CBS 122367]|uniref:MOSC domain-containing protein n=1 Tax=Lentithecium fluviatile CBS 122367 TaxID=1168545 RepID=A0A6G1JBG7_9PLEO|nr:hypothetical protein K458DRAFT_293935 [Lentithecium fluviatile CBS 122367]
MIPVYLGATAAISIFLICRLPRFLRSIPPKRTAMRVSEIYVYPIKSLRATQLTSALATTHGFQYDRRFMLLEVTPNGLKNMAVAHYPVMTQFLTSIDFDKKGSSTITVTFQSPGHKDDLRTLKIPLLPNTEELEPLDISMHASPTKSFKMPNEYSKWFSECFGYEVVFVYLGDNRRNVLFQELAPAKTASWVSTITKSIPLFNSISTADHRIGFADCAPYLVTSKTSLANVSERLPEGQDMDMTKFRPNIVIEGAKEPWEEDFWRKIKVGDSDLVMMHNCVRCKSINIDYATGKPGTNGSGEVLKRLQKDRRIDKGAKWSPVFGRYSFWGEGNAEKVLKVGDQVRVAEVNKERTVWCMLMSRILLSLPQSANTPQPGQVYHKSILRI